MYGYTDTDARFLAVEYPLGGDLSNMVGPELVKTHDYIHFELAFQTRAYFAMPNGYEVLKEYPVGLTALQALRKFVHDFPPKKVLLGERPPRSAGWISPEGTFYPTTNGHYTLAQYIVARLWVGPGNGEETLDEHGWCRVHYTGQVTPPICSFKTVTRAQKHAAKALLHTCDDPEWQEALRTFIYTVFRAKRKPREEAEEFLQEREVGV